MMPTILQSFNTTCQDAFDISDCSEATKKLSATLDVIQGGAEWTFSAIESSARCWTWVWTKSGEHIGLPAQLVWLALSAILAQNTRSMLFGTKRVVVIEKQYLPPSQETSCEKKGNSQI